MAKATLKWLGEAGDGPYTGSKEDYRGPAATDWRGQAFRQGEEVEVTDPHMIEKAKTNKFFEVTNEEKDDKKGPQPETVKPPSQQTDAQRPADKPTEPVDLTARGGVAPKKP